MTWSSLISRTVRVQVMVGLLAVIGVPNLAYSQATNPAQLQARFDQALALFNSPRQPEAIPQFSQLIDDLRAMPNRSSALTTLLARALQYRAQARENVGQTADADADLRLIREVAPDFRLTETGVSASLVARFNALAAAPSPPAARGPQPQQPVAVESPPGSIVLSFGYQYLPYTDCDHCKLPAGWYVDLAGRLLSGLSWAAEASGAIGTCCESDTGHSAVFFGGGARFHAPVRTRVAPYGQLLFGGSRKAIPDHDFSNLSAAAHLSGGVDVGFSGPWSIRGGLAYVKAFADNDGFDWMRVSIGIARMLR